MVKPDRLMLDTRACVELLRTGETEWPARIRDLDCENLAVSAIVVAELAYGADHAKDRQSKWNDLIHFLQYVAVADFDRPAAVEYGNFREALASEGTMIGRMDLLIGAHARSLQAGIATLDTADFRKIPGLHVESWSR